MNHEEHELEKLKSTKFARSYKEYHGVNFNSDKEEDRLLPLGLLLLFVFVLLLLV